MTVGAIVDDKRVYDPSLTWPGYVGPYYTKVWNGSDSVPPSDRDENPYTMDHWSFFDPVVTTIYYGAGGVYSHSGTGTYLSTKGSGARADLPIFRDSDEYKLIDKLRSQLRTHDFNLGVTVGEGRETLRMIGDIAKTLARGVGYVKKGQFTKAWALFSPFQGQKPPSVRKATAIGLTNILGRAPTRSEFRAWMYGRRLPLSLQRSLASAEAKFVATRASSYWLGYTYGIAPLLSDAYELGTAIAAQTHRKRTASYVATRRIVIPKNTVGSFSGSPYYWIDKGTSVRSVRVKATYTEVEDLNSELGLTDVATIAWEVTTMSFVADWFIPIGDYLQSLNFLRKNSAAVVRSDIWKLAYSMRSYLQGTPNVGGVVVVGPSFREYKTRLRRTIETYQSWATNLPLPKPSNLFQVESWRHAVSGIALLTARVLSLKT